MEVLDHGKSTLVNLIPRFYDVTGGELLVDGVNVKDVSQKELRKRIGFVPQKGVLFSGTIESNIKYGDINISDEQMKKSAQIAQATEFIESKENGYNSGIAQGGNNVSRRTETTFIYCKGTCYRSRNNSI